MVSDDHEPQDALTRMLLAAGWVLVQWDTQAVAWRVHSRDGHSQVIRAETLPEALQILVTQSVDGE